MGSQIVVKASQEVLFRSMIENHWVGALFPKLVRSWESPGTLIKDGFPGLAPDLWKQNFQERGLESAPNAMVSLTSTASLRKRTLSPFF